MVRNASDACGERAHIGRAFANVWDLDQSMTSGMTLELPDGSEHFPCGTCMGRLPDWGLLEVLAALVVVTVVGLGRPHSSLPSFSSNLLRGLLTFLATAGLFVSFYGEVGRRPRISAGLL